MGKSLNGNGTCCSITSLGITLMVKPKKTKGLSKKQMKLPKALRDAIMKKKKKQEIKMPYHYGGSSKGMKKTKKTKKRKKKKK